MTLKINDTAPDFTAQTTEGELSFHEWIGEGWAVLFSHPPTALLMDRVKRYATLSEILVEAFSTYCAEVKAGAFPSTEHAYSMRPGRNERRREAAARGV